jgi:hypothetical protein
MSTSPEYRQKCVALAERLEDCPRGQPVTLATHALALTLVAVALRWEDPDEAGNRLLKGQLVTRSSALRWVNLAWAAFRQ